MRVHHLLESAAREHGERPAVSDTRRTISYRELDAAANQVARVLAAHDIGPGDRVALCLPKSIEAVISIYGILKAGAAYVPIDATGPPRRAGLILDDCGVRAIVGSVRTVQRMQSQVDASACELVIVTDGGATARPRVVPWRTVAEQSPDPIAPDERSPEDLAYILYTSGSTGVPKGVAISHRASLHFVLWARRHIGLVPSDRLSSHAPFHFDLSIFDLFSSAAAAACTVLVPASLSAFPRDLAPFIEDESLTVWYSVPSVLTALVRAGDPGRFRFERLRAVLFAGEVFPVQFLRQAMAAVPHAVFYNLYGPTETNVCTCYRVDPRAVDTLTDIPIGTPIAATRVEIQGEDGRTAAKGDVGELVVRGPAVMSGYWGRPDETRRVLDAPDGDGPSRYRTGDLVRERPDGDLVFVGRRDHMVKRRGYRIELQEIEAALRAHPQVADAAVIAIQDAPATTSITAIVVPGDGRMTRESLLRFCAERLPEYMMPDAFECRDALPKTSTGKTDRASLGAARRSGLEPASTKENW